MWLKWNLLNLGLALKSFFGGLKRTAVNEVNNLSKKDEPKIAAGQSLHYETEIASKYYGFWDMDFSNFGRMNLYFLVIIAAVITTVVKFAMAGGLDMKRVSNDYLLMSAAGIGGLVLVLFFFEILRKKNDEVPIEENVYEEAERWMHYVSEKARRHMPWWAIIIIVIGLLVEAGAVSIIAASFVSDISKNEATYIGVVIGALVAAGMGWLIHNAGESLYKEHHRKRLHRVIHNEGGKNKDDKDKWVSKTYGILKEQQNDFDTIEEGFWRRHGLLLLAITVIVIFASLAFYQRAELNLDIIKGQQQMETTDELLSPDMALMPPEVLATQKDSQKEVVEEKASYAEKGMYAAIGILTMVFLIINGVGIMFGYRFCFYNDRSKQAYDEISKYKQQQALGARELKFATLARQKILKKSNQFFAKFQQHAVKQARREGLDSMNEALNERGGYRMETYVQEVRK